MAVSALSKEPYGQPIVFELAGIEKGKIWGPGHRPDLALKTSRSALALILELAKGIISAKPA
jgi:hypothetical protein